MKPLTKLYFISKFHPGVGLEPIEPISLGYTFFQTFCEYETGGINSEDIAKEIFITFFKKDHSQGIRHWKLHEPVVEEVNENAHSRQHGKTKTFERKFMMKFWERAHHTIPTFSFFEAKNDINFTP